MRKLAMVLGIVLLVFAGFTLLTVLVGLFTGQFGGITELMVVAIFGAPGYILFNWGRV